MATTQNLVIDQGSTFAATITINGANGQVYDLTDHIATAQIRKVHQSMTVTASFTATISNPTEGKVLIAMTDETTAAIKAGRYVYDLVVESGAGEKYRAVEGIVTVTPSVTR